MIVGSLYEDRNFEQRVAVTPEVIKKYKNLGLNIVLPKGYLQVQKNSYYFLCNIGPSKALA